jgi:hypothetical protein
MSTDIGTETLIADFLMTPAGKQQLKEAIQLAAAQAADTFPEGSKGEVLARALAGLPITKGLR